MNLLLLLYCFVCSTLLFNMDTTNTKNNNNKIIQQFYGCVSTVPISDDERTKAKQKSTAAAANRYAAYKFMFSKGCDKDHINNALKDL